MSRLTGVRLIGDLPASATGEVALTRVVESPAGVTHLRYRLNR